MSAGKQNSELKSNQKNIELKQHFLLLHNDDVNTFEYVIDCLIEICHHDIIQAEQCATLAHYKGKCEIKAGVFDSLKPLKDLFIIKGLNVTIE
ncbi:MAG: ATP-dependent Clp protease adaptor ClpS [Bacteroidales bacterium]|nr:ATP-dependent Clp protease adaptor ClpS [Bacteroidales bacterium]MDD4235079.1 ATP-dependent Clp protease adaptor ClpS [Bacteroidales bacterium]